MNGVHDLAGLHGFGPVAVDDGDPFHHDWEKRCFGLRVALSRGRQIPATIAEDRYAREQLAPRVYLGAAYYERWLLAGEQICVDYGVLTSDELALRRAQLAATPEAPLPANEDPELVERVLDLLRTGVSARRDVAAEPRFRVGDVVRTRNVHTAEHTRLARYLRDKRGVVDRIHGAFDLPELVVVGKRRPEWVYEVRFDAAELWGESAEPNTAVYAQLWESYLLDR